VAVQTKALGDVASAIDREAEDIIRTRLLAALPGSLFLGEETGGVLTNAPTWIVDPIDGTANYLRGYPHYAVCIALAVDGEPVLGVIADPSLSEVFSAIQGGGAFCQSGFAAEATRERLHCATRSDPFACTVATVFPKPKASFMDAYQAELGRALKRFGQVRRSGSMALDLAYLAAGRVDAFWERGMGAWDAAAGIVLLREAGADIWAMDGLPLLQSQFLAAATPAIRAHWAAALGFAP
jgi:myo-inositol-1(or 4)-monophosphatase